MSDEGLEPWRHWLNRYTAKPLPGPMQAWSVTVREVEVVLEVVPEAPTLAQVRVVVPLPGELAALSIVSAAHSLQKKQRVYTGDAELDDAVVMHVPDLGLYGAFDAATRRLITVMVERGLVAAGGALRLEPWATARLADDLVDETVEGMITLALELRMTPDERREGIAAIIESDPLDAVRTTYDQAFAAAADIRDARAKLRAQMQAGFGTGDRLELLAHQAGDKGLGLAVRQNALEQLLIEFRLTRIEACFTRVPAKLGEAIVPRVLLRLEHLEEPEERRAGARILTRLVRGWASVPVSTAIEIAKVVAPLGEPEALDFLGACASRMTESLAALGWRGLLAMSEVPAADVLKWLSPEAYMRLEDNAPYIGWELVTIGPVYLELLRRLDGDRPKLTASYLETLAHVVRKRREGGVEVARDVCQRGAELARGFLDEGDVEVVAMTIGALGEVGAVTDLARLAPLAEGFFRSGRIKDAAREALRSIREREAVRAQSGALTLADDAGGGLSVAGEADAS